jgi:hypothetical protein
VRERHRQLTQESDFSFLFPSTFPIFKRRQTFVL